MDVNGLDAGADTGADVGVDAGVDIGADTLCDGAEARVCFEFPAELDATFKVKLDAQFVGFELEPDLSAELGAGGVKRAAESEWRANGSVVVDPEPENTATVLHPELDVGMEVEVEIGADAEVGFEAVEEVVNFDIVAEAGDAETNAGVVLKV